MSSVNNRAKTRRGFSLIEALGAVIILGLGIAAVVSGLGAVSRTETRMRKIEAMTNLAQHKYDELIAITASLTANTQTGDFTDQNNYEYQWSATIEDSAVTNLEVLTVTVTPVNDNSTTAPKGIVTGMIYAPPVATTTGGTTGGG